ncbi:uncharacterized protein PAC_16108 [Phialocephala subalpina]|uniref:2EXR domain-containing protein n=1 Tax=Phialocephala subalpina TaxID=576137 RepID=A0A1L7XMN2_9HELO|nr:uncharacterized protein PAC_16108 [Phialocephala subalpina]
MTDYTSKSFQDWRENGVLHLPEPNLPATKSDIAQITSTSSASQPKKGHGYRRRRPPRPNPKLKQLTPQDLLAQAMTKYPISGLLNPALFQAYIRSPTTTPTPSPSIDSNWISRYKMREPQFHSGHSKYALSQTINTALSKEVEKMDISAHKFTLFPRLPAELRLKIWFFALPRQRLVEIMVNETFDSYLSDASSEDRWSLVKSVRSPTSVPAILHTCNESRVEALKYYHLSFGRNTSYSRNMNPRIYFDASTDVLYLNCHHFPLVTFICLLRLIGQRMDIDSMDKVITIALCHGLAKNLAEQNGSHDAIKNYIYEFPVLERVICVRHGINLPSANYLVSEGFENPSTILKPRDIASLERLFGAKVEFGISQMGKAERGYAVACSQVPGGF